MTLTPPLAGDEPARFRARWVLDGELPCEPMAAVKIAARIALAGQVRLTVGSPSCCGRDGGQSWCGKSIP